MDREWLVAEYITKGRTFASLCEELGMSRSSLWRAMRKHEVSKVAQRRSITREWLEQRYVVDLAPIEDIAAEAGCSVDTVKSWASIWGVERGHEFRRTDEGRQRYSRRHSEESRTRMSRAKQKLDDGYTRRKLIGEYQRRYLHRTIAEEVLGRELRPDEVVHHRDCGKTNHHPVNLLVIERDAHAALHIVLRRVPDLDQVQWLRANRFNVEVLADADYQISATFREWHGAYSGGEAVG